VLRRFLFGFGFRRQFSQVLHHGVRINLADGAELLFAFELVLVLTLGFKFELAFVLELEFPLPFKFVFELEFFLAFLLQLKFAFEFRQDLRFVVG
jgi:hypothetical protein